MIFPTVGMPAPKFNGAAVISTDGVQSLGHISLDELLKGRNYAILVFYPADFTPDCSERLEAFSEVSHRFSELGARMVFISTDSQFSHMVWLKQEKEEGGLKGVMVPIISDTSHAISAAYGVLEQTGVAQCATFIVDPEGIVCSVTISSALSGHCPAETLRQLTAIRSADGKA